MSDSNAVFEEVLQLGVDTEGFAAQMRQVEEIYKASINRMPELDKVSTVTVSDSLKQLSQTITQIAEGTSQVLTALAETTTENAEKMSASMSKMAASVATSMREVRGETEATTKVQKEAGGSLSDFWGGLTGNIAKSAGSLVKSLLIYKAFNEALQLTVEAVSLPFKAIAEGFTYLENVQERASIVKEALLTSVSFSKDWGENVKIAGQEADHLVQKIDDFAAKLHIKSQAVQSGLTTFLDSGGASMVKSLDDAVGVSAIITAAFQQNQPNVEGRKLLSEIPKLLQGSETAASKLAIGLGLSKDALNGVVEKAKESHDLFGELVKVAPGLVDRIANSNDRMTSLVDTLKLFKERWEALIAGPLFDRFLQILKDVLKYLYTHEDQIKNIGVAIGKLVDKAAEFTEKFINQNWQGIALVFKDLAKMAGLIAAEFANVAADAIAIAQLKEYFSGNDGTKKARDLNDQQHSAIQGDYFAGRISRDEKYNRFEASDAQLQASLQKATPSLGEIWKQWNNNVNSNYDAAHQLDGLLNQVGTDQGGGKSSPWNEHSWDSLFGPHSTSKPNSDGLHSDMQDWRGEIEAIKEAYTAAEKSIKESLAESTINHQEAAKQVKYVVDAQIYDIQKLADAEKSRLDKSGAKPAMIKANKVAVQQQADKEIQTLRDKEADADRAATEESLRVYAAKVKGEVQLEQDAVRAKKQIRQEMVKSGNMSQVTAFDLDSQDATSGYNRERDSISSQSYADGTVQRQDQLNQLALLDQKYTEEMAARVRERIELVHQEAEARKQAAWQQQRDTIDRAKIVAGGAASFDNDKSFSTETETKARNAEILAMEVKLTESQLRSAAANLAEAQAKGKNADATDKLRDEIEKLQNQRVQQGIQAIQQAGAGISNENIRAQVERREAQRQIDLAPDQDTRDALKKSTDSITKPSLQDAGSTLLDNLIGPEAQREMKAANESWAKAATTMDKLNAAANTAAAGITGLANIGSTIVGAIGQYRQGQQQGGVLGGIGSLLSSGPVSDALQMLPVVGQIVAPLGQAFSLIGQMFTQQAQDIANSIQKAVEKINNQYSDGAATLNATILALQQQRQQAITQLSGVKGGSDQLAKILPGLDQEIAQLEQQVKQIKFNFDNSLFALSQGGQALTQWVTTWQQINAQVKQYLDAGGSLAQAQTYLNDELAQQQLQLQNQLNQGQQQAISDAIQLNQLQTQKIDLVKQEQATEFGIATRDAIEKRTSAAVTTALSLQQQRDQYSQQLQTLNNQLSLTLQKVTMEKTIFNIASDTATLEQQSNALTLQQLQQQITNYQQIQQILKTTAGYNFNGTSFNDNNPYVPGFPQTGVGGAPPGGSAPVYSGGRYRLGDNPIYTTGGGSSTSGGAGGGGNFPGAHPGSSIGSINVTIVHDQSQGAIDGQKFAGYFVSEIQNQMRTGRSTF